MDYLGGFLSHPIEKSDNIIDLFDAAFWLFKRDFRSYLRLFVAISSFFSLIVFVILAGEINTKRSPLVSFIWLILGETPPGSTQPLASILRDVAFFDGSIPWIIASSVFASYVTDNRLPKQPQYRTMIYINIMLLSMLVGSLLIMLRVMGFNLLSDMVRFPALVAPYVVVVERQNAIKSLKRSFILVSKNPVRSLIVFVISLGVTRIVIASVFSGSVFVGQIIYQGDLGDTPLRVAIPLFTILISTITYPIIHIFMTLFYYDLRIRYDELDFEQRGIERHIHN